MANGVVAQFAVLSVSMSILICTLIIYRKRKTEPGPLRQVPAIRLAVETPQSMQPKPAPITVIRKSHDADGQQTQTIRAQIQSTNLEVMRVTGPPSTFALKPAKTIDV